VYMHVRLFSDGLSWTAACPPSRFPGIGDVGDTWLESGVVLSVLISTFMAK
jgi:hypothetical protein